MPSECVTCQALDVGLVDAVHHTPRKLAGHSHLSPSVRVPAGCIFVLQELARPSCRCMESCQGCAELLVGASSFSCFLDEMSLAVGCWYGECMA